LGEVGPQGLQCEDGGDGRWIMQGCQLGNLFESAFGRLLEEEGTREFVTTVDDAMSDGIDRGCISKGPFQDFADGTRRGKIRLGHHERRIVPIEDA
jgi:hypothetical protein